MKKLLYAFLLALPLCAVAGNPAESSDDYPVVFDKEQGYTHSSRRLNSVSLGEQTLQLPTPLKVYSKIDNGFLCARIGETVSPTFGYTGTWMNGFVYIDRGMDGAFEAQLNADGSIPAGSDIMAFSYAEPSVGSGNGYNSNGQPVSNANVLNPPAFKIPSDLAPGYYRMRYKVDWASIDPAGRPEDGNGIIKNGGAICDVRINIHAANGNLSVESTNGTLLADDGSELPQTVSFGKPLALKVAPADGYALDALKVLHGHNLGGAQEVHGVQQYDEEVLPGYLVNGDVITLPAEIVDGDVKIVALFAKQEGGAGGEGYALSFGKDATVNAGRPVALSLNGKEFNLDGNSAYYDFTETPVLLADTRELKVIVDNSYGKDAYLYIDLNNDGKFTAMLDDNGLPTVSSELVAFSHYNGKNGDGEAVEQGGTVGALAGYLPELLADGIYRVRLKLDKDNISPDGSESIVAEGGCVADFLVSVKSGNASLRIFTVDGCIDGLAGTALPLTVPLNQRISAVLRGAPGFAADGVTVRHGHNLDAEQYVNGNRQWAEEYVSVKAGRLVINADLVDGDVYLFAEFKKKEDSEWQLVFSDEFNAEDYTQPLDEKWMRCQRYGSTWNRWLSNSKEVIYLQGGDLVARAIPNPDQESDPVPMITGGIKSNKRFGFTYGYVEARILSNPWTGHFPAFWMMPEDQSAGWPDCGEIDIWEAIDTDGRSYHTIHSNWTYDLGNKNDPQSSFNKTIPYDRYHTYGLKWDANTLIWYIDGKEVGRYTKSTDNSKLSQGQWPFDKHFHLILNQSVGNGSWAANADVSHTYETRFDWVRVYQTDGMKNTDGTVGVLKVFDDNAVEVTATDGGAYVAASEPLLVEAYDTIGRKVAQAFIEDSGFIPLTKGIYVIAGNKVLVK